MYTMSFSKQTFENRPIAAARPEFQPQGKTMSASSTAAKYRCVENQTNEWKNKITMLIYFKCIEGKMGPLLIQVYTDVNGYSWLEQMKTHTDCKGLFF